MINKNNLSFFEYDASNIEQNKFIESLKNDEEVKFFLPRIDQENAVKTFPTVLLVKDIYIDQYIGVCIIMNSYSSDTIYLEYAINKRSRNKGYGTSLLSKVTEQLFKDPNVKKIILDIQHKNEASKAIALKNGYSIDYEIFEKYIDEGYASTPYSSKNPNIK